MVLSDDKHYLFIVLKADDSATRKNNALIKVYTDNTLGTNKQGTIVQSGLNKGAHILDSVKEITVNQLVVVHDTIQDAGSVTRQVDYLITTSQTKFKKTIVESLNFEDFVA